MHIQARIQKWGNSLALRLSGPLKDIPDFKENMLVDIEIAETGIQIHPAVVTKKRKKLPFTESQLLENLTSKTGHADELFPLHGKEILE